MSVATTSPEFPNAQRMAAEILSWHFEAGVDACLDETPINHLVYWEEQAQVQKAQDQHARIENERMQNSAQKTAAVKAASSAINTASLLRNAAPIAPELAQEDARKRASAANSLPELKAAMEGFEGCGLKNQARQLVFGAGNPQAEWMFIGDTPNRDDDEQGQPFLGQAGKLLDAMLKACGRTRVDVYLSHVIGWRPPGDRAPTAQELQICKPFILREIELVNPRIIVCLGGVATASLLDKNEGILRMRGNIYPLTIGDKQFEVLVTLHPAYLLKQSLQKRLAWRDLQMLMQVPAKAI